MEAQAEHHTSTTEDGNTEQKPRRERIHLTVTDQQGDQFIFSLKYSWTFRKLFDAYGKVKSVDPKGYRFLFEGKHLRSEQTPNEFGMEDGDEINAMLEQRGGHAQG